MHDAWVPGELYGRHYIHPYCALLDFYKQTTLNINDKAGKTGKTGKTINLRIFFSAIIHPSWITHGADFPFQIFIKIA